MKIYTFELKKDPIYFEVKAESQDEAYNLLTNCDDLTEYKVEYYDNVEQFDFEFINEEEIVKDKKKLYKVLLTRYPSGIEVEAKNQEEALQKAKKQIDFSVWESEVEEL